MAVLSIILLPIIIFMGVTVSLYTNTSVVQRAEQAKEQAKELYEREQEADYKIDIDGKTFNSVDEYFDSLNH